VIVPPEIYGTQTPREIAEEIISRSGKFADTAEDGASSDSVIVVSHLTKQFGQRVAFEDVSFNVHRAKSSDSSVLTELARPQPFERSAPWSRRRQEPPRWLGFRSTPIATWRFVIESP